MPSHYRGSRAELRALGAHIKLMRAAGSVQAVLERRLLEHQLTENQFGALEMLYHLGPQHQHALGQKLFTSKGNVTVMVDRLERRGLVRRERDAHDRRLVGVHLTDAGRELVQAILPGHVQTIVALMSALGPKEQEALAALCKRLGLAASEVGGA